MKRGSLLVNTVVVCLCGIGALRAQQTDMEIEYLYRLRDEMKFQNPAILKAQIQDDARRSLKFFRLLRRFHEERHV